MTTYNTGNPVPSADARDRYDNSQTLDEVVNGDSESYTSRTGKQVISLGGMNSRFNNAQEARESAFNLSQEAFQSFLEGSGWSSIGAYGAGLAITSHTQTVDYLGQPYSLKPSIPASLDSPYITTGVWATEGVNFKLVGDNSLRQELASDDGGQLVSFLQSGDGAEPRSVSGRLKDSVSVKDFGAVGDGITNDTAAFQACFSAHPHGDIKVPNGVYILTGTLTKNSGVISGEGRDSVLVFDNMNGADGCIFNPQNRQTLSGAAFLTVLARGTNGGRAFVAPHDSIQYATRRSAYIFDNLYIAGYTLPAPGTQNAFETIETWLCGIETGDGIGCDITNYQFFGNYRSDTNHELQVQSCGIRLRAAYTLLTAQLSKLTITNAYRGIEIGQKTFWQITNFDISHSFDGVYQIEAGAFNECILSNGNVNSQHTGVYFYDIGGRRIDTVIVRRHRFGWKSANYTWYGLKMERCNSTWISKFQAEPSEVDGVFTGDQYNIHLDTCGGVFMDSVLVGATCDIGVLLSNCAQVTISNTESFQNALEATMFRFINNTRNTHVGNYAAVSSFKGTILSRDASTQANPIQMMNQEFDFQTAGSSAMRMTRTNAAADNRIWGTTLGVTTLNRQAVTDAGVGQTFEMISRNGSVVEEIQWRAAQLRLGNAGPIIRSGSGSPEGLITGPPGSLWLSTTSGHGNYQKLTGIGNTGWVLI